MRSLKLSFCLAAISILSTPAFAADPPGSDIIGETNPFAPLMGNRFDGVWWIEGIGGSPGIFTATRAGLLFSQGSLDTSPQLPFQLTPAVGVWVRTGARSSRSVLLRYVKNPEGETTGFERIHIESHFAGDFNHREGTFSIEVFACETVMLPPSPSFFSTVPDCPNPTEDVAGQFPPPAQNVPFTASRVTLRRR